MNPYQLVKAEYLEDVEPYRLISEKRAPFGERLQDVQSALRNLDQQVADIADSYPVHFDSSEEGNSQSFRRRLDALLITLLSPDEARRDLLNWELQEGRPYRNFLNRVRQAARRQRRDLAAAYSVSRLASKISGYDRALLKELQQLQAGLPEVAALEALDEAQIEALREEWLLEMQEILPESKLRPEDITEVMRRFGLVVTAQMVAAWLPQLGLPAAAEAFPEINQILNEQVGLIVGTMTAVSLLAIARRVLNDKELFAEYGYNHDLIHSLALKPVIQ